MGPSSCATGSSCVCMWVVGCVCVCVYVCVFMCVCDLASSGQILKHGAGISFTDAQWATYTERLKHAINKPKGVTLIEFDRYVRAVLKGMSSTPRPPPWEQPRLPPPLA